MVLFIHTADWQIGMKATGMGEAGALIRDTRIQSIDNVFKIAQQNQAEFVLVCGDAFEDNQVSTEDVKKVVSIFNQYPEIPVYLLPGNHDYLGPGSVYRHPLFSSVRNLTIFNSSEPVRHGVVTLYPAPIVVNKRTDDPTMCIPDTSGTEGIRIGVGHGSLEGSFYTDQKIEFPIDPNCIQRTGLHYLALGHHHNKRFFPVDGVVRIAYSGTHEQTSFDETESGYCLLVDIPDEKTEPTITPHKTGQLEWGLIETQLSDQLSLNNLSEMLEKEVGKPILKLKVGGQLPFKLKNEYEQLLEYHDTHHPCYKLDISLDYTYPTDISEIIEINDPTVKRTAERLRDLIKGETDEKKKGELVESLGYLYKAVTEASQ